MILLGTVIAIGVLFFRVIRPFVFPLFFAGVLAVLFRPLFLWVKHRCCGRRRIAAAVVTTIVITVFLLPLSGVLALAGMQLLQVGRDLVGALDLPQNADEARQMVDAQQNPWLSDRIGWLQDQLPDDSIQQIREATTKALLGSTQMMYERTRALAGDVVTFVIGLVVMVLSLYYFLSDGEHLLAEAKRLVPLEEEDEDELLEQFEQVCRGVVLGTVVAAVIQGVLALLGFAMIGIERIWLLAVFTMFSSFIPFLGAAAVWVAVTIGLVVEQRYGAAVFLSIYGTVVISGSDNLIRAYIIHNRAQMHPLVALVTVLGALQLVGLWGIFIGPISASFFYALLNIIRRRLVKDRDDNFPSDTIHETSI
jgi:predicted PurR-regulated permease PerM